MHILQYVSHLHGAAFQAAALLVSRNVGGCNYIAGELASLFENLFQVLRLHALEGIKGENFLDVREVADAEVDVAEGWIVGGHIEPRIMFAM